ncbi:D-alanyl-D-alanine carboxypeptidase family protein [bacterium]|nr:D-alanyl-D-alanine carboxypeptidase family protein [bacterium]
MNFEILVNKNNLLSKDYKPKLYIVDDNKNNFHNYIDPNLKPELALEIKSYVDKLLNDAWKSGMFIIVDSGYRSYEYQEKVLKSLIEKKGDEAYRLVAIPGSSEHQTGLAMDIAYMKNGIYSDDVKDSDKEVEWMKKNSYKYGFILRYPKGKEEITGYDYEPWHYRFVGINLAKILYDQNITMEEYYSLKRKKA